MTCPPSRSPLTRNASCRRVPNCSAGMVLVFCLLLTACRHAGNHNTQPLTGDSPIVAPSGPESAPSIETALALETFDAAWQLINDTHFDPNHNGVDWLALRQELRPRAETATTQRELRRVVGEMLARLEQSHFALLPREAVDALDPKKLVASNATKSEQSEASDEAEDVQPRPGDTGLKVRIVDQDIVVRKVQVGGPADESGVKPGWVVKRIGGVDVADLFDKVPEDLEPRMARFYIWRTVTSLLHGDTGDEVEVEFLNELNEPIELALSRRPVPGTPVKFGNLPTFFTHLESEQMTGEDGRTIGVIRFNMWMTAIARPFHEAIDQFRDADGIVIDLRGNPGGVGGMAMGIAGHFVNEKTTLGTMTTRNTELKFISNPRRSTANGERANPFDGPVAILVDGQTGSTSEIFAGGMQAIGRARIFGEASLGAALPALMDRLPNGDVLLHAFADYVDANGIRLEGRGVIPDEEMTVSRGDLLAGRDPTLSAAIAWINQSSVGANHEDDN